MTEHSKEPWYVGAEYEQLDPGIFIADAAGLIVCSADSEPTKENARRIVACINACSVYPTEFLEDVSNKQGTVWAHIEALTSQRDELLAALKGILEMVDIPDPNCSCHIAPPCNDCVEYGGIRIAIAEASAAITKAEGKA